MKIPNFNSISESNKWLPDRSHKSQPSIFSILIRTIKQNPRLVLPHSTILAITLCISGANLFYNSTKNELEPYHEQYTQLNNELNILKTTNKELEKQYEPAYDFIVNSIHPFIFAKELQTLIPRDVQLRSYDLSNTTVSIEASSEMQRSLDDFIVFFANHPLLKPESLEILEITSSVANPSAGFQQFGDIDSSYTQQPLRQYNVKLIAEYKKPEEDLLLKLLLKTGNVGLLEKVRAFNPNLQ